MAKNPTPVTVRRCAVNSERWARLIPNQPDCSKPVSKPTAALCATHEKRLPDGWRKLDADRPRVRAAKANGASKPKAESNVVQMPNAVDVIPAHLMHKGPLPTSMAAYATPQLEAAAKAKREARRPKPKAK